MRRHGPDHAHACQLLLQSGAAGADRPECMKCLAADLRAAGHAGTVLCDPALRTAVGTKTDVNHGGASHRRQALDYK